MGFRICNFHDQLSNGLRRLGAVSATPVQHQAIALIRDGRDLPGLARTRTAENYRRRSGRASRLEEAYTCAMAGDRKMIRRLERTLKGGLVYRDSPETGMMADAVIDRGGTGKNKMVATVRKNQRRVGGKRSSQPNRGFSLILVSRNLDSDKLFYQDNQVSSRNIIRYLDTQLNGSRENQA